MGDIALTTPNQQFALKHNELNEALSAAFMPSSANAEARTIDVVFSAGSKVIRVPFFAEPYYLQLRIDESSIRLGRLNNGAPLLNTHNSYSLESQIGVVEKAWIKDGLAYATIRFSKRAEVDAIWQDVLDGIYRGISPGVNIFSWEETHNENEKYKTILATDWEAMELSLCPVQADPGAHTLSDETTKVNFQNHKGEDTMPTIENAPEKNQVDLKAAADEAIKQERLRASQIRDAVKKAKLGDEFATKLVEEGVSLTDAHKRIIDAWAEADSKVETKTQLRVEVTQDESVVRVAAMESSILHRADPQRNKLSDEGRRYMGMSLMELAKVSLNARGIKHEGESKLQIAHLALHSTSDFPKVLANAAGKALRKAYEQAPQTFWPFVNKAYAPDFKTVSRVQLGEGIGLLEVPEGGEITRATVGESREQYALATYARIIGISRQAIINDDLSAFSRLPRMFGAAAANLESDVVYAILTANAAMEDTVDLFHADHGNLGTTGVISETTLSELRKLMRKQTGIDGKVLNLIPKFLIVPAAIEAVALRYLTTEVSPTQPSEVNIHKGSMSLIVEPRLDAHSASIYYAAASPDQIDTIECLYLEGQEGLYLEERVGFDVDGVEIKGRLDFAAKAIDHRGLFSNGQS
jgi:hypothetical protein